MWPLLRAMQLFSLSSVADLAGFAGAHVFLLRCALPILPDFRNRDDRDATCLWLEGMRGRIVKVRETGDEPAC
jgi:hypothetical protein